MADGMDWDALRDRDEGHPESHTVSKFLKLCRSCMVGDRVQKLVRVSTVNNSGVWATWRLRKDSFLSMGTDTGQGKSVRPHLWTEKKTWLKKKHVCPSKWYLHRSWRYVKNKVDSYIMSILKSQERSLFYFWNGWGVYVCIHMCAGVHVCLPACMHVNVRSFVPSFFFVF